MLPIPEGEAAPSPLDEEDADSSEPDPCALGVPELGIEDLTAARAELTSAPRPGAIGSSSETLPPEAAVCLAG